MGRNTDGTRDEGGGGFDSILSRVSIPLFSFAPVYPMCVCVCVCVLELQAQAWPGYL